MGGTASLLPPAGLGCGEARASVSPGMGPLSMGWGFKVKGWVRRGRVIPRDTGDRGGGSWCGIHTHGGTPGALVPLHGSVLVPPPPWLCPCPQPNVGDGTWGPLVTLSQYCMALGCCLAPVPPSTPQCPGTGGRPSSPPISRYPYPAPLLQGGLGAPWLCPHDTGGEEV